MAGQKKSWEKRLKGQPDPKTVDFVESLSYDFRLYKYDIAGSIAHAQMLYEQNLILKDEYNQIKAGLLEIQKRIEDGKFKFDKTYEDIHMAIEAALVQKIGNAGKKLHTGRSRNDQVATDIRLWLRDQIKSISAKIRSLQKTFVKMASKYEQDIMPAYTHLQRAQPVAMGIYLLSFVEQLDRDLTRFENCRSLANVCPLGSGAIAGSTLPLDRKITAKRLGFADISYNSIDAVSDRDFAAEFIFDCSLAAIHLSRLAEDWIIYSSNEFDFIGIDDKYCTSSSMMPQKRNPDLLELIRAKTAGVLGELVAMLTILKALPTGYNRDLQEDKLHLFRAADAVVASLDVAKAIVSNTKFNTRKIKSSLDQGFLDATALAEYLVGKGIAFREAHGIVGGLVAFCESKRKKLADLSIETLKEHCGLIDVDVYDSLGAENIVKRYQTEGSAGLKQLAEQIVFWNKKLNA
ncbi:MAG: argininosuccinate lyase [Phycisphaerae bacterium]|nr:argininosuccinate lyase [Phycisphaerae bacterium]